MLWSDFFVCLRSLFSFGGLLDQWRLPPTLNFLKLRAEDFLLFLSCPPISLCFLPSAYLRFPPAFSDFDTPVFASRVIFHSFNSYMVFFMARNELALLRPLFVASPLGGTQRVRTWLSWQCDFLLFSFPSWSFFTDAPLVFP